MVGALSTMRLCQCIGASHCGFVREAPIYWRFAYKVLKSAVSVQNYNNGISTAHITLTIDCVGNNSIIKPHIKPHKVCHGARDQNFQALSPFLSAGEEPGYEARKRRRNELTA